MKKLLKKILLGITLPQEYLCFNLKEFNNPLRVFIKESKSQQLLDITEHHLFIGYKPLLIAIDKKYLLNDDVSIFQNVKISFRTDDDIEIAVVELNLLKEINLDSVECLLFQGVQGMIRFIHPFHKLTRRIYYYLTSDKKQNIFLAGNLYDQVKIAYSIPRKVYFAAVGLENLFNIFPTDLSGHFGSKHFIISLRSGGKANQQIVDQGKCLIAIMEAESFMEVYSAGKNHMKELSDINNIGIILRSERSAQYDLPIPNGAVEYLELKEIDQFEFGIHIIHFFRIINSVKLSNKESILAHLHRDYAEWRIKNKIETKYLLRNS